MATFRVIHTIGESLLRYLRDNYPSNLPRLNCQQISSGDLAGQDEPQDTLSLFLYRVTLNEHLRNTKPNNGFPVKKDLPLSLDLHYLMTVWTTNAQTEHEVLGWAMLQFHLNPILELPLLGEEDKPEIVQIIPVDLSNEDIMRIWDRLKPSYRLSVAYVARVVQIESDRLEDSRPVVATRLGFSDRHPPLEETS